MTIVVAEHGQPGNAYEHTQQITTRVPVTDELRSFVAGVLRAIDGVPTSHRVAAHGALNPHVVVTLRWGTEHATYKAHGTGRVAGDEINRTLRELLAEAAGAVERGSIGR